ncbi:uncharacterized protein SCHCODRAFT_02673869 [Schizophyllum commune H4-8]|uniref:uncharacterized protein n=1 Tax=Schizophyllum commune (strain H4-8 / FGSC 9210) TaxID=578458 RepID=UPI00215F43C1|nr:uncharacterized protein SCHCODRAFT_02673869 [Schizophyllum commune H4-8]KAI5884860.1 hypothetical protein SCHCODRAFT_02673869 [Schizophyllum commune H4-8]
MPEPAFGIEHTGQAGGSSNSCISPRVRFIWRLFLLLSLVAIVYSIPKDVKVAFLTVPNPYTDVCKMYMDRFITAILIFVVNFCLQWVYSLPLRLAACGILYIVLLRTERCVVRLLSPLVNGVLSLTTFHLKMVPGKPYKPRLLDYMAFNPLLAFFAACHAGFWLGEGWLPYQTLAIAVTVIYMLYTNMPASPPFSPLRTWLTGFVCLVFAAYRAGLQAALTFDLPPLFKHEEIVIVWSRYPLIFVYPKDDEVLVVIDFVLSLRTLALIVGVVLAFAAAYRFMVTEFVVPAVVSCARLVRQKMRSKEEKTMFATCMAITPRKAMELQVEHQVEQKQGTDIVRSLSIYPSPIGPMNQTVVTTDNVEVTLTVYTRPIVYTTTAVYTTPVVYLAPVTYLADVAYTAPVVFKASVMFSEQGRVLFMGPAMQVVPLMVEAPMENANMEAEERVREIAGPVLANNTSTIEVVMRKRKSMDLQPAFATLKMHILLMHLAEFIPESATRASVDPKTAVCDESALNDMTFMVESETSSEVDEDAPAAVEPVTCASAAQVISFMVEDTIHASVEPEGVNTEQAELSIDPPDVVVAPLDVPEAPAGAHADEQVNECTATPALDEMPSAAPVFSEANDAPAEAAAHVEEPTYVEKISLVGPTTVTPIVVEQSSSDDSSVGDGWITSSPTPSSRTSLADDDQPDKELAADDLNEAAAQDHDSREGAAVAITYARSKISDFDRVKERLRELKSEAETATRKPLAVRPTIKAGFLGHLTSAVARPPATQSSPRRFTAAEKGKGRAQEIPEDPFMEESLADQHTEEHVAEDYPAQDDSLANSVAGLPSIDFGDAPADWADDTEAFYFKTTGQPKMTLLPVTTVSTTTTTTMTTALLPWVDVSVSPRRLLANDLQRLPRSFLVGQHRPLPRQPTREHQGPSSYGHNETRHGGGPSTPRRPARHPRQAKDRATRSAGMRPHKAGSAEGAADGDWKRDDPESSSGPSTSTSRHAPHTPPPARRFEREDRAGGSSNRDITSTSRAGPSGLHGLPPRPAWIDNDQRPDRRAPRNYTLQDRTDDELHSGFGGMRSDALDHEASRSGPSSSSPRYPPRHGHQNGTPNPHHGPRDDQARRQPRQDGAPSHAEPDEARPFDESMIRAQRFESDPHRREFDYRVCFLPHCPLAFCRPVMSATVRASIVPKSSSSFPRTQDWERAHALGEGAVHRSVEDEDDIDSSDEDTTDGLAGTPAVRAADAVSRVAATDGEMSRYLAGAGLDGAEGLGR